MYATYCKLCRLSLIITKIVLDVCKPLHIMSFSPNQLVFMVKYDQVDPTGFDWKLHDLILRSKVFTKLESILCERSVSNAVREASVFAIAELIRFNKDVFVGQILISKTVCALISLTSVRSIQILCTLIRSIKSPIVDEIVSGDIIPKLVGFLTSDEVSIRAVAVNCVLEIRYFGRKEAIDAMLEADLVKRLVELQRCENGDVFGSCLLMVGWVGLNGFCLKIIIIQQED
ncbi:putative armadillo-like helical protein [Helianthus anomalus]